MIWYLSYVWYDIFAMEPIIIIQPTKKKKRYSFQSLKKYSPSHTFCFCNEKVLKYVESNQSFVQLCPFFSLSYVHTNAIFFISHFHNADETALFHGLPTLLQYNTKAVTPSGGSVKYLP